MVGNAIFRAIESKAQMHEVIPGLHLCLFFTMIRNSIVWNGDIIYGLIDITIG